MDSIALRLQRLDSADQVLALTQIAQARAEGSTVAPSDIDDLFIAVGVPRPTRVSNVLARLKREGLVTKGKSQGSWVVTPEGRNKVSGLFLEGDLRALVAEMEGEGSSILAGFVHPVLPATLAPPQLVSPLSDFLQQHPFETNVFGMTRFPEEWGSPQEPDPVAPALEAARVACEARGLEFHLASDRAIVDDLWSNVAAHMWGSKYGIAFFEERVRALNYNMTIEVGSMLMAGRRCALLKDASIERMPTDLVGRIYKDVDLEDPDTVGTAVASWIQDDLGLSRPS